MDAAKGWKAVIHQGRVNDASAPMHNNGSAGLLTPLVAHEFSGQRIPNQSHDTHANHDAAQYL
ncbi:MAG TPA: hypothetical protein VIE69_10875, partial [Methylophilaceae bacterium]